MKLAKVVTIQAKSRGKRAPEPEPTLALGYCKKCRNSTAFCSCKSNLSYNPLERWALNTNSPKWFEPRKITLQRFCIYSGKNLYQLFDLAGSHKPGEPQFELELLLSKYLEAREKEGVAKSTIGKEAGTICGFFACCYIKGIMIPKKYRTKGSTYEGQRVITPQEAHKMIECASSLEEMLVVCLLTQLGQRIGILTALRYDMIKPFPDGWGYVELKGDYKDSEGEAVGRKIETHYCFLIHPESMALINKMREEQQGKSEYVFTIGIRDMERIFYKLANKSGIQKAIDTTLKSSTGRIRKKYEVHPHIQRGFFEKHMLEGKAAEGLPDKIADIFIDFLMGHTDKYGFTYVRGILQDDKLLAAYKRAEPNLSILNLPSDDTQRGIVKP